jgi:hypothetical protein
MRFIKEKEILDAYWKSTHKTKTKFLWWPLTIKGETRWLETATIEYKVDWKYDLFLDKYYYWSPIKFINE